MLKQVSIYAENKKELLKYHRNSCTGKNQYLGVFCTNDGTEFESTAWSFPSRNVPVQKALEGAGYLCRLTSVIGVELEDEVGNLNRLLRALAESNININYTYLSFNRASGKPVLIFHTEDSAEVESCIQNKGFATV